MRRNEIFKWHYLTGTVLLRKQVVIFFCTLILIAENLSVNGQNGLKKIIPLSPNAASISKFNEIPVSNFTGIPSISIPIYNIEGREISVPISMSYHAGGNKVEDIASWVGLGWTLGSIPSISRSIRGLADEEANGYFSLYNGKSIKEIYDNRGGGAGQAAYEAFINDVHQEQADSEADIFHVNLLNSSAKFYFNQTTLKFYTVPQVNIKVERLSNGFRVIGEDGLRYDFTKAEITFYNLKQSTNTWWVHKIIHPNLTDSIVFDYNLESESFNTKTNVSKNIFISGELCSFPQYEESYITTQHGSLKPSKITFSKGYVKFISQESERSDLFGSHALDRIEIYDYNNRLIKKVRFSYLYMHNGNSGMDNYRLLLDKMWEEELSGNSQSPYSFVYNNSIVVPSRLSNEQDYWGYYNAASTNVDLVPTIYYHDFSNQYRKLSGANRNVNEIAAQFAILKKIIYPTGGNTSFVFEGHRLNDPGLPIITKDTSITLSGNGINQGEHGLFEKKFQMDLPPDPELNNSLGGSFVNIILAGFGCDLSNGANICATFTISGQDQGNSNINMQITGSQLDIFLPNGLYKMKAEFYQDPPQYQNFVFQVNWKKPDSLQISNKYAGGLRIKKIVNSDSSTDSRVVRQYEYITDTITKQLSGRILGSSYFNFSNYYFYTKLTPLQDICLVCTSQLLKNYSNSNITQVSHSGSFVGYGKVWVYYGENSHDGRTEFTYSTIADIVSTSFPYPPPKSHEQRRGLLLEQSDFRKTGNGFSIVKRIRNNYGNVLSSTYLTASVNLSLKIAVRDVIVNQCLSLPPVPETIVVAYDDQVDDMKLIQSEETIFHADDTTRFNVSKVFKYYNENTAYIIKDKTYTSKGDLIEIVYKYPGDLSLAGDAESARAKLILQNRNNTVLQMSKSINLGKLELTQTNYKIFGTEQVQPNISLVQVKNYDIEPKISFISYDVYGNILEQKTKNDIVQSYIWDYNSSYPIAEVINSNVSDIAYTSFEADGNGNWSNYTGEISLAYGNLMAPTGIKFYNLTPSAALSKQVTYSKKYIVSYWSKNSSAYQILGAVGTSEQGTSIDGWILYTHRITTTSTSITISGTGLIDEVRLYPEGAQMTTYTYEPLIGLKSQTDVNNSTTYFEYDNLRRLVLIRDQTRKAIKKYCYNYFGQVEDCSIKYFNVERSTTVTRNNCPVGYTGSQVVYTVPAGFYQSDVSQEAADLMATNDILANAQNYANTNGQCIVNCSTSNCTGADKKCINNVCETGIKVLISTVQIGTKLWECTYQYRWSDGTWSASFVEQAPTKCTIQPV